jgi:hypothetical protein
MITDPVTCNSSAGTARHSGTSALIAFALLNGRRGARTNLRAKPETFRRTFAPIAALNARPFWLG